MRVDISVSAAAIDVKRYNISSADAPAIANEIVDFVRCQEPDTEVTIAIERDLYRVGHIFSPIELRNANFPSAIVSAAVARMVSTLSGLEKA